LLLIFFSGTGSIFFDPAEKHFFTNSDTPPAPYPSKTGHTVIQISQTEFISFGGYQGSCRDDTRKYDRVSGSWTTLPNFPNAAYSASGKLYVNSNGEKVIYAFGGRGEYTILHTDELSSITIKIWIPLIIYVYFYSSHTCNRKSGWNIFPEKITLKHIQGLSHGFDNNWSCF
jgi:hypothetical protein